MTMSRARKTVVGLALAWAFVAPCLVWLQDLREDGVSRRLRALAAARLGASPQEMTNAVVMIPRGSVEMIAELSRAEAIKSDLAMTVVLASSAALVALVSMSVTRTGREKNVT
jgi:hypothetical protein